MKLACITQRQWPITAQTCHWSLGRPIGPSSWLFSWADAVAVACCLLPVASFQLAKVAVQPFPAHVCLTDWMTDWLTDWLGWGTGGSRLVLGLGLILALGFGLGLGPSINETWRMWPAAAADASRCFANGIVVVHGEKNRRVLLLVQSNLKSNII